MKYDTFGQPHCDSSALADLLYQNPELDLQNFWVTDPEQYNNSSTALYLDLPQLKKYHEPDAEQSVAEFDQKLQHQWRMPDSYANLDIAQWSLDQCDTDAKLQRVAQELLLYQERGLFDLLRYLKFFVDTMRKHQVLWGVGRGSSVASYVLFLIGVHRIDSMYFDLDIREFLK